VVSSVLGELGPIVHIQKCFKSLNISRSNLEFLENQNFGKPIHPSRQFPPFQVQMVIIKQFVNKFVFCSFYRQFLIEQHGEKHSENRTSS
jgi:hypothetical protein